MERDIEAILAKIRGARDISEPMTLVREWAGEGRVAELADLRRALDAALEAADGDAWAYETVADEIEEQLALAPGRDRVTALLDLSATTRARSVKVPQPRETRLRALASRLGFGQNTETLLAMLALPLPLPEHEELLACWLHEAVLRGASVVDEPRAVAFQAELARKGHPLGAMPLELLESEREAPSYMPMYGDSALHRAVERLERGPLSGPTMPPPSDHVSTRPTRVPAVEIERRLEVAFEPWVRHSNGKVEAKVFALSPAVSAGTLGKWLLRALPLDCLEDAKRVVCDRVTPAAVFGALFAASANGGAYSSGSGGAYGRRGAWTSMGALIDAPPAASVEEIEALARSSAFLLFSAPESSWFHDVAWDVGALALRPGGATVAVVAGTDTD
jgi:hypothetical protein